MTKLAGALLVAVPLAVTAQEPSTAPAPAAAPAAAAPEVRPAAAAPLRDGVYLGVGVGGFALSGPDDSGIAYRIRVGMTRSPRLMFGFEASHAEGGSSTLSWYDVSATFFPGSRIFFVRGGFGFTGLTYVERIVIPGGGTIEVASGGGSGVNVLAGLGAQLGRSDGINFTVNVEAQSHWVSQTGAGGSQYGGLSAWLGLEWH